jgi:hypothetical protein
LHLVAVAVVDNFLIWQPVAVAVGPNMVQKPDPTGPHISNLNDLWCKCLKDAAFFPHGIKEVDGLLYAGERLIIPRTLNVHESLFHLAHDVLGHFGFLKSYGSLHDSFYWPNM